MEKEVNMLEILKKPGLNVSKEFKIKIGNGDFIKTRIKTKLYKGKILYYFDFLDEAEIIDITDYDLWENLPRFTKVLVKLNEDDKKWKEVYLLEYDKDCVYPFKCTNLNPDDFDENSDDFDLYSICKLLEEE